MNEIRYTIIFAFITVTFILGLGSIIIDGFYNFLYLVIPLMIIGEVLFFIEKDTPDKKKHLLFFTAKRKVTNIAKSFVIVVSGYFTIRLSKPLYEWIIANHQMILIVVIILVCVYGFIKLNSLKYRNIKYNEKKKPNKGHKNVGGGF